MSNQEHHELYELLMSYLKAMQALSNSQKHIESLRGQYHTHQVLLWHAEPREITCTVSTNNYKHKPSTCIARIFSLEKIFHLFRPPALMGEIFYPVNLLSHVNDCIESVWQSLLHGQKDISVIQGYVGWAKFMSNKNFWPYCTYTCIIIIDGWLSEST